MKELLAIPVAIAAAFVAIVVYDFFQSFLMQIMSAEGSTYDMIWVAFGVVVGYGLSFFFDQETDNGRVYYNGISIVVYGAILAYSSDMSGAYLTFGVLLSNAWFFIKAAIAKK